MKKTATLLLVIGILFSCASHSGRVCGGRGGKRCVETSLKKEVLIKKKIIKIA